ncbi:MAG: M23 family metallopeptidase [Persicimonas sp.]
MSDQAPARKDDEHDDSQAAAGERDWRDEPVDHSFELWAKISLGMGALSALGWVVVLLRLGVPSVYTHAFIIATLGFLTMPVMFWGLVKSFFNPPLVRRSRIIAFGVLLATAFFGNVPYFTVPLSTADWESSHEYRLPFDGEWAVTAGGDSTDTNYHATTAAYRWAYDFTRVEDGKRHRGEGKELADYYCYGEPVLASAAGEVIRAEDGNEDNEPGEFDEQSVLGNHVIVEVDEDEYLFVAHMKEESLAVEEGARVEPGEKLGECGNSGRSINPHVHVHLQNSTKFPMSEGLPLRFSDYTADGEPVELGMPKGSSDSESPFGQRVKP